MKYVKRAALWIVAGFLLYAVLIAIAVMVLPEDPWPPHQWMRDADDVGMRP